MGLEICVNGVSYVVHLDYAEVFEKIIKPKKNNYFISGNC